MHLRNPLNANFLVFEGEKKSAKRDILFLLFNQTIIFKFYKKKNSDSIWARQNNIKFVKKPTDSVIDHNYITLSCNIFLRVILLLLNVINVYSAC